MFSRSIALTYPILVFALTIFIGCSGDNQKAKMPELKAGGCLSDAPQEFDHFLKGKSSSEDVTQFWNCVQKTLTTFEKYTRGEKSDQYKSTEIRSFLQAYFLGDIRISDSLLQEMMQLKRLLLKGNADVITRAELTRAQTVLDQLRDITLNLAPHMSVLSSEQFASVAATPDGRKKFTAARTAVQNAFEQVAFIVKNNQEDYDLSRLAVLLDELDQLFRKEKVQDSHFENLGRYAALIANLKAAFISQPSKTLVAQDFPVLAQTASDLLFVYLEAKYYLNKDWDQGQGLQDLDQIFDHGYAIVEAGVKRKPGANISFAELDPVFDAMGGLDFIPLDLKAKTAQITFKVLLQKIFKSPHVTEVDGLSLAGLQVLRQEWKGYIEAQKFAEKSWTEKRWMDAANSAPAQELIRAAESPYPLKKDNLGRLVLEAKPADWFWDRTSLTSLNWQRLLIRFLVLGYATGKDLDNLKGLTKEQLTVAAKDFFPLGIDVGFFSEDKPNIAKQVFQEANLFMPRSDGNDLVNYEEGVDYLAYALSGIAARREFLRLSEAICPVQIVNDEKLIDVSCFRAELDAHRNFYFANLPGIVAEFIRRPDSDWQSLEKNLETTVRKNGFQPNPITGGEIVQLFILSQYLETFMLRYDLNHNQTLNLNESYVAYGVYKNILKDLLSGFVSTDDDVLNIYTFMFNYGETPLSGVGGMLKYVNWRVKREMGQWEYEADRIRLSQILSSLSAL